MGILLVIIVGLILFWPFIVRLMRWYMLRKSEDFVRRMAGAPTRAEEKRARKQQEKQTARPGSRYRRRRRAAEMMNEVAEDVEFTEIREFTETDINIGSGPKRQQRIYRESQVEDAVFTEIKKKTG